MVRHLLTFARPSTRRIVGEKYQTKLAAPKKHNGRSVYIIRTFSSHAYLGGIIILTISVVIEYFR